MSDSAVCPECGTTLVGHGGWLAQELDDCVVVLPLYEEGHVLGRDCWCTPRVEELDRPLAVHRDLPEREGVDPRVEAS
jgi:hypothetical protein